MLPPLRDLSSTARVVDLPLAVPFRGLTSREALLVEGSRGWSEFSPFVEYDDVESSRWLRACIEFGWEEIPPPLRARVDVNATVPAVDASEVASVLRRFPGARTAKVKVAHAESDLAADIARVAEVRRILGPGGRIRIDANGAWNLDEAEHAVHALAEFDLEYIEQPCLDAGDQFELLRRIAYLGIGIAADEEVRKAPDPEAVDLTGVANVVVLKAQPLGGVAAGLRVAAAHGLPAVVSSALDTSVGLSMGAHLAAALPELDYDCGLGTGALLAADVTDEPLLPIDGAIDVRRVDVSSSRLDEHAASDERRDWWIERLSRCYAVLNARAAG
ncbi:MAG: o-succinylbenzoate synthase [Naasia sp.]